MTNTVLKTRTKRKFDPSKKEDMKEYKYFRDNNTWRDVCPFELEFPFLEIPTMINDRIVKHTLDNL